MTKSASTLLRDYCVSIAIPKEKYDQMKNSTGRITKALNKKYYGLDTDETTHRYYVGSIGRKTANDETSDLDILFALPESVYERFDAYQSNGQSALIQEIKEVIQKEYPTSTNISGDGQVVEIAFTDRNYNIEVVPGFLNGNDSFRYPDTHEGGSWKNTNPLKEQQASKDCQRETDYKYYHFCRLLRSWKNNRGFIFKGILIDSLVYNFMTKNLWVKTENDYLKIFQELLNYISGHIPFITITYTALGSNDIIEVDNTDFIEWAKSDYDLLKDESTNDIEALREILGPDFYEVNSIEDKNRAKTEEFIQEKFAIDLKENIQIKAEYTGKGFRKYPVSKFLAQFKRLSPLGSIDFEVIPVDFQLRPTDKIFWKVRNTGPVAKQKNCERGQIVKGNLKHSEPLSFYGDHYVECYIIRNNSCIAIKRYKVPIS